MGNIKVDGDVQRTLETREGEYGNAWKVVGQVLTLLQVVAPFERLFQTSYTHNWVMILSKLVRAIFSPNNTDHWRDIAGYATLVLNDLKRKETKDEG